MWRNYDFIMNIYVKTVKKKKNSKKKQQSLFLTTKILETSEFHWVFGKSFLEWRINMKIGLGSKYSFLLVQRGLHQPFTTMYSFLNDYHTTNGSRNTINVNDLLSHSLTAMICFLTQEWCGFGSDVLFTADHFRSISSFCQNAYHDWLTKEYISNWFLVKGCENNVPKKIH